MKPNKLPQIWTPERAICQNPELPCPQELLDCQRLLQVQYVDFEGIERLGAIVMHEDTAADAISFFDLAHRLRFPIAQVVPAVAYGFDDAKMMAANNSSGFNFRYIKGTKQISAHAGWAFDINPVQNPYIRYIGDSIDVNPPSAEYNPEAPGTLYSDHPLVCLMRDLGWEWGGDWTPQSGRVDYQHFQKPPALLTKQIP